MENKFNLSFPWFRKKKKNKTCYLRNNRNSLRNLVLRTQVLQRSPIIKIEKRYMLSQIWHKVYRRNTIQHVLPSLKTPKNQSCTMATYVPYIRTKQPEKLSYPIAKIDPISGYEIMNPIDYSGKNHILLGDFDYKSENYYMVLGSFTTSYSSYLGKKPVFISETTLQGKSKYQILHIYGKPKIILKTDVDLNPKDIICWPSKDV